jgi:hypothetical protein
MLYDGVWIAMCAHGLSVGIVQGRPSGFAWAPARCSPLRTRFGSCLCSFRGQIQVGSLTGAVHLSNDNAGVPRPAHRDQKSHVEHKGLSWLDPDFQYEYGR